MGFSTQHTRQGRQYAPNTRNVVNSVFNTMASFNSSLNSNNSLLSHIRSWQRSRRLRSLSKNSVVNPMNNLCYQSMLPKSCTDISSTHHQSHMPVSHKSVPVVSFRNNGGEGAIAMQLVNRVMINENQLYSMHLASRENATLSHNHTSARNQLHRTLSDNCYESLEPPQETEFAKNDPMNQEIWYYGDIDREKATQLVARACTGSFLVRSSSSFKHSFALTVKVPLDHSHTGVCHYLILRTDERKFKIKGFTKEFETIQSLIIHHTIMKEQLPCTLKLQSSSFNNKSLSCSQLGYNTVNRSNGSLYGTQCGNFYTYGMQSCSALNAQPDNDDLMVDIDLDPTYQKILDNFRKVMAHCS